MSNKLSQSQIDEMFAVFLEHQNTNKVVKILGYSEQTVSKYRKSEEWDKRLARIKAAAMQEHDARAAIVMAEFQKTILDMMEAYSDAFDRYSVTMADMSFDKVITAGQLLMALKKAGFNESLGSIDLKADDSLQRLIDKLDEIRERHKDD